MKRLKVGYNDEKNITEVMEEFIQEKEILGRSKDTLRGYRDDFAKFIKFAGKDIKLSEINKKTVLSYQKWLKDSLPSVYSVNSNLRGLRTFLNWAYENEYIPSKIFVEMVKGQESIKEVYTDEELLLLLEKPKSNDFGEWRNWAVINWILGTGNRVGTIINIQMKDIDLARGEVIICKQKNKKVSSQPLDSTLVQVMKTYIRKCRNGAKDEDYLFPNVYGQQASDNSIQLGIYKYNHKRGVKKTSAHALRHTFAKLYIMNGGDLVRLQKLLGHSSLEMARHYVNLYGPDLKIGFDENSPLHRLTKKYAEEPKATRLKLVRR